MTYSSEVNTCQGLFKKRGSGDLRQFKCVFLWFAFPQFHLDYRAEETCLNGALKVVFFETANKKSNIIISCDFMLVRGLIIIIIITDGGKTAHTLIMRWQEKEGRGGRKRFSFGLL